MILNFDNWHSAINSAEWKWKFFTPEEMHCRGSGRLLVNIEFMDKLTAIRREFGQALYVISGYRTPQYNASISRQKSLTGAHTYGRAVDVRFASRQLEVPRFLSLARKHGMTRVGLAVTEAFWRLHIDDMTAEDGFAVRDDGHLFCWTY